MRIGVRIFLGYFIIVGLAAWILIDTARDTLKPALRQAMEDNLVDSANLIAEQVHDELLAGKIRKGAFAAQVDRAEERHLNARIWGIPKDAVDYRIYITNAKGIVVYDSDGNAVGQDYSRWNDVYLTLRGRYGARSSQNSDGDSVLHVAAPVIDQGKIIGVVTIAKPAASVQPFIFRAYHGLAKAGIAALVISLLIGLLLSWWLTRSLYRLVQYAAAVGRGERNVQLPHLGGREVRVLGDALENMRAELEGKRYVEEYVHALTHELKSPIAAIQGAAELIDADMPAQDQARFLDNIQQETARLTTIIDRLLALAQLEGQRQLDHKSRIDIAELVKQVSALKSSSLALRGLCMDIEVPADIAVQGDYFLLQQALSNLLDNAIAFSPEQGTIRIGAHIDDDQVVLTVADSGAGIPDFALERVFERFYSLPRPHGGRKSTGLGLPFVREVASLHGGSITLENRPQGGAIATLRLPRDHFI